MTNMPVVVDAQYDGEYRIRVTFDDASQNTIDFREWLEGPMFEPLKDTQYFRRFFVSGGTVTWPNGKTEEFRSLGTGRAYTCVEGQGISPLDHF